MGRRGVVLLFEIIFRVQTMGVSEQTVGENSIYWHTDPATARPEEAATQLPFSLPLVGEDDGNSIDARSNQSGTRSRSQ